MLNQIAPALAANPKGGGAAGGGGAAAPATNAGQEGADHRWVFVSVLIVFVGWLLFRGSTKSGAVLVEGIGVFALLYVTAQAIERLLEPIVSLDPFKIRFERRRNAAAAMARTDPDDAAMAKTATAAQTDMKRWKANRAVVVWALATLVAMWASSTVGIFVLRMMIATPEGQALPSVDLDVLVTGLVIGGGTKPLHDLISRVEASSTSANTSSSTP